MLQKLQGVPVCSGIDWITVTCRPSEEMERMRERAFALAAVEMSNGEFGRPWQASGYEGFSVGGVFYGERYDGCIYQLTSHVAASFWRQAYEDCSSVTRLDLQATFCVSEDPYVVIQRHYKELKKRARRMRKPPKLRLVVADLQSATVYTGAPCSDRFGYIYDKGRESGENSFKNCVRYEVRLRGNKAKATAHACFTRGSKGSQVALRCLAFFSERGVSIQSLRKSFDSTASFDDLKYPVMATTLDRKSEWLRKQVSPTVRLIQDRIGRDGILELLGLH